MKNSYYIRIFNDLFNSLIEDEKGYSEDLRLIQQMLEDIIYHNKLSSYVIEEIKEKINISKDNLLIKKEKQENICNKLR